ncbi:HET-domain-containing protein [Xylaria intraflava]|nr:HET-domain-containing protein [Xylaria intraflava]
MALCKRLCASCSTISLLDILPGVSFSVDAEPLPGRDICNLCDFVRGALTCAGEVNWLQPIDAEALAPSPLHAIKINFEQAKDQCKRHPHTIIVAKVSITDTWHGHRHHGDIYFRNPSSVCGLPCEDSSGVPATWANLSIARKWLGECMADHSDCQPLESLGPASILHRLTRFIDVQLGRLVQLEDIVGIPVEYIALSYVWGKDYQLRTTSHTIQEFKRRLASDSDTADVLPKTVQDAVIVTRALGYRFLWVDALCIIQDSPADLDVQLAQMDRIYGLSVLTIVARGSTSSNSGLSGISLPRNMLKGAHAEVALNNGLSVGLWDLQCYEKHAATHDESADNRFYIWRGWTFQEQILSTRNLELGPKRMSFSCGRKSEPHEHGYPEQRSDIHHPNHFRYALRQFERTNANHPDTKKPYNDMTPDMLMSRWTAVRQTYSTRSLSYPIDRARAIQGTAQMFRRLVGRDIDRNGHMENELQRELTWYTPSQPAGPDFAPSRFPRNPAPKGLFPSWSWLSLWPVTWGAMPMPFPGVKLRIYSDGDSNANSLLEIDGPTIQLRVMIHPEKPGERKLCFPDGELVGAKLYLDETLAPGTGVTCAPVAKAIFGGMSGWEYAALLLLRVEQSYHVRVGISTIPETRAGEFLERMSSGNGQGKIIVC